MIVKPARIQPFFAIPVPSLYISPFSYLRSEVTLYTCYLQQSLESGLLHQIASHRKSVEGKHSVFKVEPPLSPGPFGLAYCSIPERDTSLTPNQTTDIDPSSLFFSALILLILPYLEHRQTVFNHPSTNHFLPGRHQACLCKFRVRLQDELGEEWEETKVEQHHLS